MISKGGFLRPTILRVRSRQITPTRLGKSVARASADSPVKDPPCVGNFQGAEQEHGCSNRTRTRNTHPSSPYYRCGPEAARNFQQTTFKKIA